MKLAAMKTLTLVHRPFLYCISEDRLNLCLFLFLRRQLHFLFASTRPQFIYQNNNSSNSRSIESQVTLDSHGISSFLNNTITLNPISKKLKSIQSMY